MLKVHFILATPWFRISRLTMLLLTQEYARYSENGHCVVVQLPHYRLLQSFDTEQGH
jgi:hypothetical protein